MLEHPCRERGYLCVMGYSVPKPPPNMRNAINSLLGEMRCLQDLHSSPDSKFVNKWGPTPDWLADFKGYVSDKYWIPRTRPSREYDVVVARYLDEKTREPKFVVPYLLSSNAQPVPILGKIWKYLSKSLDDVPEGCEMRENGVLTKAGGMPDEHCMSYVVDSICYIWRNWKDFPTIDDYALVNRLQNSVDCVFQMRDEMAFNPLQNEIAQKRTKVQELLDSIEQLEKNLNRIYEDGAAALNLLEENGYPMDIDKLIEERKRWNDI